MHNAGHILVVDDSPDLAKAIKFALEQKDYEVSIAENGERALSMVAQAMPDLILLDMKMPVMDGWGFARHFYDRYGRKVPIVVMTAAEDSRMRSTEIGADSYIGKPFELTNLYALIEDMMVRDT